ncbi:hypothetical protein D3C79_733300 [compost metagenome]
MNEGHHGAIQVGSGHHAGAQGHLQHIAIRGGIDHCLLQVVLRFAQLGLQIVDGRLLLIYLRRDVIDVGLCHIQIALLADTTAHQLFRPIPVKHRRAQPGVDGVEALLAGGETGGQTVDLLLEAHRIYLEQHVALLHGLVGLDGDLGHSSLHQGNDGGGDVVIPGRLGIGVVVVHQGDEGPYDEDATKHGGRYSPLVERDLEDLENPYTDGRIGENK